PNDQIGGQVIGFVNIDDEGLSGLELYYNDILTGTPGRMVAERGEGGIPIPGGVTEDTNAVNGQDIIVSLDLGMQGYLEDRLAQGVKDLEGKGGNSVIMDGGTGEILACASLPYLNPSDRSKVEAGATELKSITTAFEPGSIFKAVPILGVLEAGLMTPDDTLFCPAYLPADEYFVSDAHERGDETMSLRKIFANSSNVGL
ncbi:MAG: penicillin-binding transpeptidase domain-containing protein, partial [Raoultibacter sp.]